MLRLVCVILRSAIFWGPAPAAPLGFHAIAGFDPAVWRQVIDSVSNQDQDHKNYVLRSDEEEDVGPAVAIDAKASKCL